MSKSDRRLRIAVLNRVFTATAGGAERYSMALVEQIAERHEIHVFAQTIEHRWPGVTYHRVSAPLKKPRWINQLWYATATWWATRRGFDVVHSHENTWHGQVQTQHVLPVRYNLFHGRSGWRLARRWLQVFTSARLWTYLALERARFAPQPGRSIVVTSTSLLAKMAQTFPASAASMRVVTPGIADVINMPTDAQQLLARAQLGLPASGRGILLVANDYRKKGLDALLGALRRLPPDYWLAVVGEAGQIARYRQRAADECVVERVTFLGPLADVAPAYTAVDCLAHPTLEDTFAMVVLEAMAHALPVLVSDPRYCGIAGALQDGQNALILNDPRDSVALALALGRLFQAPGLRQRLREQALLFARQHLWSEIAARQEAIYFSVVDGSLPSCKPKR